MAEFKLVLNEKKGKSSQVIVKDKESKALLKRRLGDRFSGSEIGMEGYEFEITGGSDKCGFPMRKGIQQRRQKIKIKGKGVGFSGKDRNKKKQKGLMRKRTVCGERIEEGIVQINLKVLKEGKKAEDKAAGEPKEEGTTEKEKKAEEKTEEKKKEGKEEKEAGERKEEEMKEETEKEKIKKEEKVSKQKEEA